MCELEPGTGDLHVTGEEAVAMEGVRKLRVRNGDPAARPRVFVEEIVAHGRTVVIICTILLSVAGGYFAQVRTLERAIQRLENALLNRTADRWGGGHEVAGSDRLAEKNQNLGLVPLTMEDVRAIQSTVTLKESKL